MAMRLPVDEVIPYCELCGAWAEFTAVPLWPESGSLPPPDLASVALCGSCLADGVPPGWHTMPLPVAGEAERAMPTPQTEDLPRTYRWNLWRRPDGTNFLSWGQPRDPVEHEQLVRTFESENWQTAAQEAFGSAPEIDTALRPLVGVLHHFPSVLVATARLDHTEHGQRLAVIGLTIDSVWCLRRLLCSLTAASQSKTAWELMVDADDGWLRKLPPNGMALTLKIHLRDAAPVSLADFADDLPRKRPGQNDAIEEGKMKENENPACQGHRRPTEEATTTAKKSRFPQRWFCEECAAVHPLPHLTSRRLCGFRNCINVIAPKQTACGELHQLLLARECGRSRQENLYQSPLVPTGDWLFAERHRLRKTRQDLAQILYPIAGHRACSNALYYIEVGDLNVPPGWLPALAALGFSVLPEALLETTLSASWLVQAIDESFDPRTACIVTMAWFGLTEGRLQHWARERRLLPHCFLPALYFHGLIFTG